MAKSPYIALPFDYESAKLIWLETHKALNGFDATWRHQHNIPMKGKTVDLFNEKTLSFALVKAPGGWRVASITTQSDKVIKQEFTEIEYKNFALERMISMISNKLMEEE